MKNACGHHPKIQAFTSIVGIILPALLACSTAGTVGRNAEQGSRASSSTHRVGHGGQAGRVTPGTGWSTALSQAIGGGTSGASSPIPVATETTSQTSLAETYAQSPPTGMVRIAAGTFQMGSAGRLTYETSFDERAAHAVTLKAFLLDQHEVTVQEYSRCVQAGKCGAPNGCNWGKPELAQHPVNCVNWHDATDYCAWSGKRLPTEEEWEFAAKGRAGRKYPWGEAEPERQLCWRRSNPTETCPVGSHPESTTAEGVQDLAGNVMEWLSSTYCYYQPDAKCFPKRVVRGCSYVDSKPWLCRSARRASLAPEDRLPTVGFRCARSD